MNVCIYARVDGAAGSDRQPLDLQIDGLKNFAAVYGYTISSVVSFFGPSSANGQSLQTLLTKARNNEFDAVLMVNPSRISRDADSYRAFRDELSACGKKIIYSAGLCSNDELSLRVRERLKALYEKESARR